MQARFLRRSGYCNGFIWLFNEFEYCNELAHFQPTRFCGYLSSCQFYMEKWRHFRLVVFIHDVNQYNWSIPSVNVSYILNTSFVNSFFILHIYLTEYKHILCEKCVFFANSVWKSESCRRTLAFIFQTNNTILMKYWHVLHNEMTNYLQFTD